MGSSPSLCLWLLLPHPSHLRTDRQTVAAQPPPKPRTLPDGFPVAPLSCTTLTECQQAAAQPLAGQPPRSNGKRVPRNSCRCSYSQHRVYKCLFRVQSVNHMQHSRPDRPHTTCCGSAAQHRSSKQQPRPATGRAAHAAAIQSTSAWQRATTHLTNYY